MLTHVSFGPGNFLEKTDPERICVGDSWRATLFPGLAIGLVVMAGSFLVDWLRDCLDPTLRQLR